MASGRAILKEYMIDKGTPGTERRVSAHRTAVRWCAIAGMLALCACSTTKQARTVEPSGLVADPAILVSGGGREALRFYKNPAARWDCYTKVLVEPVDITALDRATGDEKIELRRIADRFDALLREEFGKDYEIVTSPEPDTIRVRAVITGAQKKMRGMNAVTTVAPVGIVASILKDATTGKPLFVGEISIETEITDAVSGAVLSAAVDRRVGQKYCAGFFDAWAEARHGITYWARKLRSDLCELRGDSCQP